MEGEPPARSRVGFYSPQPRVSPFVYNFYYIERNVRSIIGNLKF